MNLREDKQLERRLESNGENDKRWLHAETSEGIVFCSGVLTNYSIARDMRAYRLRIQRRIRFVKGKKSTRNQ